jgi:hypothetical protein
MTEETWPVAAGAGAAAESGRLCRADVEAVTAYFAWCSADQVRDEGMPRFEDRLHAGLMREYGSALEEARLPAASRRHLPSRWALLASGVGGLAASEEVR